MIRLKELSEAHTCGTRLLVTRPRSGNFYVDRNLLAMIVAIRC